MQKIQNILFLLINLDEQELLNYKYHNFNCALLRLTISTVMVQV